MRYQALNFTAAKLGLKLKDDNEVYGVVMDWGLGDDGTCTLVCYLTGDASIYYSNGGGQIGGGHSHEAIKKAAISYVRYAQQLLPLTTIAQPAAVDTGNYVRFYLLTTKGLHTAKARMEEIDNRSWKLAALFDEANKVITEYVKVMEEGRR